MENVKNYSYRVMIRPPKGMDGLGTVYFIGDKDLKEMCPHNEIKCIPQHYNTVAYELIPDFLKKKTGEKWYCSKNDFDSLSDSTTCRYDTYEGRAAWLELFKGKEIMFNWDEEDRIPSFSCPEFSVVMPGKDVTRANSPKFVPKTIVDAIINDVKYHNYITSIIANTNK